MKVLRLLITVTFYISTLPIRIALLIYGGFASIILQIKGITTIKEYWKSDLYGIKKTLITDWNWIKTGSLY